MGESVAGRGWWGFPPNINIYKKGTQAPKLYTGARMRGAAATQKSDLKQLNYYFNSWLKVYYVLLLEY